MVKGEVDVGKDEIAQRLDPTPGRRRLTEQAPSCLGKLFRIAVSAPQEKNECLFRQILYRMLLRRSCNDVRRTRVLDDRRVRDPDLPFGGYDTAAPVAEAIAIGGYRDRQVRLYVIRNDGI